MKLFAISAGFSALLVAEAWVVRTPASKRRASLRNKMSLATEQGAPPQAMTKPQHSKQLVSGSSSSAVSPQGSSGQQTIKDHGDTYLTISLEIGSQKISAIPDSGSFDLYIVDGADCELEMCQPAYKPDESFRHFEPINALKKDIYFGSGACGVELSFDSVQVHNEMGASSTSESALIPLWRITEMDDNLFSVWGDGQGFQGIVGLGFKGNVHKEAKEALMEQQVVLEAKQKTGVHPTAPGLASKALFGDVFAICLPRGEDANSVEVFLEDGSSHPSQTDGRLWWGDSVPPLAFKEVPVVGVRHWTIRIDSAFFEFGADRGSGSDSSHHICGGPSASPCAALVDSGTSLIAMSPAKINELLYSTMIGDLNPDCSNVDSMPDLIFNLGGGQTLVLTPDTYVMKISASEELPIMHEKNGRVVLEKGKVLNIRSPPSNMSKLKSFHTTGDSVTYCTHAFMETPMETALVGGTEHELIILGIPVFREYSIKFDRKKETLGFAAHPFGVTCHSNELSSALIETERHAAGGPRKLHIRQLGKIHDLVFPDEFGNI